MAARLAAPRAGVLGLARARHHLLEAHQRPHLVRQLAPLRSALPALEQQPHQQQARLPLAALEQPHPKPLQQGACLAPLPASLPAAAASVLAGPALRHLAQAARPRLEHPRRLSLAAGPLSALPAQVAGSLEGHPHPLLALHRLPQAHSAEPALQPSAHQALAPLVPPPPQPPAQAHLEPAAVLRSGPRALLLLLNRRHLAVLAAAQLQAGSLGRQPAQAPCLAAQPRQPSGRPPSRASSAPQPPVQTPRPAAHFLAAAALSAPPPRRPPAACSARRKTLPPRRLAVLALAAA